MYNYKDLDIQQSYKSQGDNTIPDAFLNPVLKCSKEYDRSVGFFSSGVLDTIMEGITVMAQNGGKVRLIASPKLNEEDVEAIETGYKQRDQVITEAFTRDYQQELNKLSDLRLQLLCDLIRENILDIKIAITDGYGIYHDKLGILHDFDGNTIVFYGSSNSSYSGYRSNYEKIRVVKGWEGNNHTIIDDEQEEFFSLWNNTNEFVEVFEYTDTAEKELIEIINVRKGSGSKSAAIKLRDYQENAINAWTNNNYHGFYVMATGTGKTWTAIYSAKSLIEKHSCMVVICAPYKHLVKQWSEDVQSAFPEASIVLVSSENPGWDRQITDEIIKCSYNKNHQVIIISTIASFNTKRFMETILKHKGERLLIVDEAHRFTNRPEVLHRIFNYMLGLSATPFSGSSAEKGKELLDFFGGQVFSLPIEVALEKGYLVPYYYKPIYVTATIEEEEKFNKLTKVILSCFRNNQCINPDLLVKSLRNRLRLISMASEKQEKIDRIIGDINEKDHVVVYCGDGRLFDNDTKQELRHIQAVKKVLTKHDYKASQFTASESMMERMSLVDSFNKGEISALAAIRCLDEGINIPSIKSALILSSNDDYREFVQRRGRILRTYENKKNATIYDVVVLPSTDMKSWAIIEFRRFLEYGKLAINWPELKIELSEMLNEYGINLEEIDVYDYEDMGEESDE